MTALIPSLRFATFVRPVLFTLSAAAAEISTRPADFDAFWDAQLAALGKVPPVLIAAGELDTICPSEGITLTVAALAGPKEFLLMPGADHQGENNTHQPYNDRSQAWLEALRSGKPAPVP